MNWKILCYGMKNKNSRYFWRRIPAKICIIFSKIESGRTAKKLSRTFIPLPSPKYSADDILHTAAKN